MPADAWVMFRVGKRKCALPVRLAIETMRPLPVRPVTRARPGVIGVAIVRGASVPVLDVGVLFGEPRGAPRRFLTLRVGERVVALAVDDVLGVARVSAERWEQVPKLLDDADAAVVRAIAKLDQELVLALDAGRLPVEEAVG